MSSQASLDLLTEALFVSDIQRSESASPEQIRTVVTETVQRHGEGGCAELVAQEFGEHPDSAVGRMRWARSVIGNAYLGH
jgi:hypothetical protein